MFTAVWHRFTHGHEWDPMDCKTREFDTYEKAKAFLLGRLERISGIYWAGGCVVDDQGTWLLDITSEGEIEELQR